MLNKTFIIKVKYGGLGDHLFWSHLPRIAKTVAGFEKVYISNLSEYRKPEYKKLVWELNPFVDDFCDEDAPYPEFEDLLPGMNLLDRLMIERGIDDGKRFHEPEIFYDSRLKHEFKECRIFDPNYVSYVGDISNRKLIRLLNANGKIDYQLKLHEKYYGVQKDVAELQTASIFDYCDLIKSCKEFICLSSGGATLAAALNKPSIVFYGYGQKSYFHHSRLHKYFNASSKYTIFKRKVIEKGRIVRSHLISGN